MYGYLVGMVEVRWHIRGVNERVMMAIEEAALILCFKRRSG
tara:strand:- start:793 stop:915 length:123 start_codon:yes stop_codon:yes gene_type:complete